MSNIIDERHDWTRARAEAIYSQPFNDLLFQAQTVHRRHFDPNTIQLSRLLNVKTGGCAEDCAYCSQSSHYSTGLSASKLMEVERVITEAQKAKTAGATRYCMGAAWRSPKQRDLDVLCAMVRGVKALGMETCMTLGMLTSRDAERSNSRASITTTTTSIRPSVLQRHHYDEDFRGPPGNAGPCAQAPASRFAAGASSAWERSQRIGSTCW